MSGVKSLLVLFSDQCSPPKETKTGQFYLKTQTRCEHPPENLERVSQDDQLSFHKLYTVRSTTLRPGQTPEPAVGSFDSTAGWCASLRLTGCGVRNHRPERSPLTSTTAGRNPGTTAIKPHSLMVALNCCSEIRWLRAKLVEL